MLVVGSRYPNNAKTEILSGAWSWTESTTYPFHESISYSPILFLRSTFYVFGGYTDKEVSTIATFNPKSEKWTKLGDLETARNAHGVIAFQDYLLVLGGNNHKMTEKCTLSENAIYCNSTDQKLYAFAHYPLLTMVDSDICD